MQGIVLNFDAKSDTGIIKGEDNIRYEFKTDACCNDIPLTGSTVDFEIKENKASDIYTLKRPLKAKLDWLFWFLFYSRGRISRDQYVSFLACSVLALPLPVILMTLSGLSSVFSLVFSLIVLHIFISVTVKRFHDSNSSAFWIYFTLIFGFFIMLLATKILNLAFISPIGLYVLFSLLALSGLFCLYLCFAKGTIGKNRYGDEANSCQTVRLK